MHTELIKGSGAPLVMLHGWGQESEAMRPLANILKSQNSPYLIDLPGFGKSKMPNDVWSSFDYADKIISYLDEMGIDKAHFLGHSFGGKVAMSIAIRYPHRVKKLILLASTGVKIKGKTNLKLKLAAKLIKGWDKVFKTRYFEDKFVKKYGSQDYKNAGPMRPILVKTVNEDISLQIKEIQAETLLLWGEKDQDTPPEMGKKIHSLIKNSTLILFPKHDHQLVKDVSSHLMGKKILNFLSEEKS